MAMATFEGYLSIGSKRVVVESTIGKGAFGVVHKVRNPEGQVYALKDILCMDASAIEEALGEVEMLRQVSHDNVVQIVDSAKHRMADGDHILILTEFCSGGNLNERLDRPNSHAVALKWIKQLASALSYLHDRNIVHRDLKPENVLLTDSHKEDIKISDFGLAREYLALIRSSEDALITYYMSTYAGTPGWMAPEVFVGHYTDRADVFSLGCIFYSILSRQYVNDSGGKRYYGAFVSVPGQGKVGLGYAMAKINSEFMVEFPPTSTASEALRQITTDALQCNPRNRPTARALCERITASEGAPIGLFNPAIPTQFFP